MIKKGKGSKESKKGRINGEMPKRESGKEGRRWDR